MIAPEFLRPLPSMCMVKFNPRKGMLENNYTLKKGIRIYSNPVGKNLIACEFQSTRKVDMFGVELKSVRYLFDNHSGGGLKFNFVFEKGVNFNSFCANSLTLYVAGEKSRAWSILSCLTEKNSTVRVEIDGIPEPHGTKVPRLRAGGFNDRDNLLPGSQSSLGQAGYLLEYFSFEEKFRFIEIENLEFLKNKKGIFSFSLTVFAEEVKSLEHINFEGIFNLFVSPVINLFEIQADPVNLDMKSFAYRVTTGRENRDIYSIEKVTGIEKNTGRKNNYEKYSESSGPQSLSYLFHRDNQKGNSFGGNISLSLPQSMDNLTEEYLSLSIMATDGSLPRKEVPIDGINTPSAEIPAFISLSNITRPTAPAYPPRKKDYKWYVINHLNASLKSISSPGNLQRILELYNWSERPSFKKFISELISVSSEVKSFIRGSTFLKGTEITLKFRDSFFENRGEANIFGTVLIRFLNRYVSLNYLVSLRFKAETSVSEMNWDPMEGRCQPQ